MTPPLTVIASRFSAAPRATNGIPDHMGSIARLARAAERCNANVPLEVAMKSRLIRLAYGLARLDLDQL